MQLLRATLLIAMVCVTWCGCVVAPTPKAIPEEAPPQVIEEAPFEISEVSLDKRIFNPSQGETVMISYRLSQPGKAIVMIFGPDMKQVAELMSEHGGPLGIHRVLWDGRDMMGNIIPDEAYFFTVEAGDYTGHFAHYDPTTFSGGEYYDLPVEFDSNDHLLTYDLPDDARLSIRAGITRGPLLKKILDWTPRLAGCIEEPWDGKDESGNVNAFEQKGFSLVAEAVTLPKNSMIALGNLETSYFKYRKDIITDSPIKEERPLFQNERTRLRPETFRPVQAGFEPRFHLELPEVSKTNEGGIPMVSGKLPVKIHLENEVKRDATELRYEIISFVDFEFATEQEEGYSPSTWVWDSTLVPNGEHILTVNVATLTGQLASASMKVMVQN